MTAVPGAPGPRRLGGSSSPICSPGGFARALALVSVGLRLIFRLRTLGIRRDSRRITREIIESGQPRLQSHFPAHSRQSITVNLPNPASPDYPLGITIATQLRTI